MQRLELATDVYADPSAVYELLVAFDDYARFSEHLEDVTRHGDGTPGTEYDLTVSWWRLSHTARSRVTDVDPPNRIDWRLVSDLSARGQWLIEDVSEPLGSADPPDAVEPDAGDEPAVDESPVTRVRLVAEYDPASADADALGLPVLCSVDTLVDRATPIVREEAERVVERVVAELEGEPRTIDLEVQWKRE